MSHRFRLITLALLLGIGAAQAAELAAGAFL